VVEGLVALGPYFGRDCLVPFLAVGEDGVNVEDDAAKVVESVAHDIADGESCPRPQRCVDDTPGLGREE
jgi:hypothetical protein